MGPAARRASTSLAVRAAAVVEADDAGRRTATTRWCRRRRPARSAPAIGRKKPQVGTAPAPARRSGRAARARRRTSAAPPPGGPRGDSTRARPSPSSQNASWSTSCVVGGLEARLSAAGPRRRSAAGRRRRGRRGRSGRPRAARPGASSGADRAAGGPRRPCTCGARRAGHRDRPAPPAVPRAGAVEGVGDAPARPRVRSPGARRRRRPRPPHRRGPGQVDGGDQGGVRGHRAGPTRTGRCRRRGYPASHRSSARSVGHGVRASAGRSRCRSARGHCPTRGAAANLRAAPVAGAQHGRMRAATTAGAAGGAGRAAALGRWSAGGRRAADGARVRARRAPPCAAPPPGDRTRVGPPQAQGAGESGLARVIEMHGVSAAGDALVLLSLANTVFFSVPVGEARGRVALYLLVTMLPFSRDGPGDRAAAGPVPHGRRYALAATLVGRAFLAWVMAGAVAGGKEAFALYPAAFGHLVLSKAYQVTRAAATPRVLPPALSLVTANSRVLLGGIVGGGRGDPDRRRLLKLAGPGVVAAAGLRRLRGGHRAGAALPAKVDSAAGERGARLSSRHRSRASGGAAPVGPPQRTTSATDETQPIPAEPAPTSARGRRAAGASARASCSACGRPSALRGLHRLPDPVPGLRPAHRAAVRLAAADRRHRPGRRRPPVSATPSARRSAPLLRRLTPEVVVAAMLAWRRRRGAGCADVQPGDRAGHRPLRRAGGRARQAALDALVQREVPEEVRTSAFARSETVLQLAWVVGGGVGIALPVAGRLGSGPRSRGPDRVLVVTAREAWAGRRPPA